MGHGVRSPQLPPSGLQKITREGGSWRRLCRETRWPGASFSLPAATCLGFSKQSREDDAADAEQSDLEHVEAAVEQVDSYVRAQVLWLSRHGAAQYLITRCT